MFLRWKTLIDATLALAISLALVGALALVQDGRKFKITAAKASPKTVVNAKAFPFPATPPKPTWVGWRVEALPNVEGEKRDYHLGLAKELSLMDFVPDERMGHFRALDTPEYRLDGWHGYIESATPTPNGAIVELRVTPLVTYSMGASTTVLSRLIERYQVTNGEARYLGAKAPPEGAFGGVVVD